MVKAKPKFITRSGTIAEFFDEGYSEIEALKEEMESWRDNYQDVSECCDSLDSALDSKPDETDLPEGEVSCQIQVERNSPR